MLKIIYFIFCLLIFKSVLCNIAPDGWLSHIVQEVQLVESPHQVTVYTDCSLTNQNLTTEVLQKMNDDVPRVAVDFCASNSKDKQLLRPSTLETIDHSFVTIVVTSQSETLQRFIDLVAKSSPKRTRSKLLGILENEDLGEESKIYDVLKYAWLKFFLDFSVILKINGTQFIYHLNPFFNTLTKAEITSSTNIFPNKLSDVNRYPLKLFTYDNPPFLYYFINAHQELDIDGIYFPLLRITAEKMNFAIKMIPLPQNTSYIESMKLSKIALETGQINLITVPQTYRLVKDHFAIETYAACAKFVPIVPILSREKITIPLNVFAYFMIIPVASFTIVVFAKITKTWTITLDNFKIIRMMLGVSFPDNYHTMGDEFIMICLFIVYLTYTIELYSAVVDTNVIEGKIPFETFMDLHDSQLELAAHQVGYDNAFQGHDNGDVMKLAPRTRIVNSERDCIEELLATRNIMCLMDRWMAEFHVRRYKDVDGNPIMKIARPEFSCEKSVFYLEDNSPYAARFIDIIMRIHEAALWKPLDYLERLTRYGSFGESLYDKQVAKGNSHLSRQLLSILIVCYTICIVVFALELLIKPSLMRRFLSKVKT